MKNRTIGKRRFLGISGFVFVMFFFWISSGGWFWKRPVKVEATEFLMDTSFNVKVFAKDNKTGENMIRNAFAEARRIEHIMEPVKGNGELKKINTRSNDEWIVLSSDLKTVLDEVLFFYECSGGAFDPTIASVKWLWDFENGGRLPSQDEIKRKLELVGFSRIEFKSKSIRFNDHETKLDLGGVAKGYAVDRMMNILTDGDIYAGLINAGGDIITFGKKPGDKNWKIGVRHPRLNRTLVLDNVSLSAIATSGDYERYFIEDGVRYNHILDPATGYPAHGCVSVTTWAKSVIDADILSTAIFVMGPEKGLVFAESMENVETLIFFEEDGELKTVMTSGIEGKIPL